MLIEYTITRRLYRNGYSIRINGPPALLHRYPTRFKSRLFNDQLKVGFNNLDLFTRLELLRQAEKLYPHIRKYAIKRLPQHQPVLVQYNEETEVYLLSGTPIEVVAMIMNATLEPALIEHTERARQGRIQALQDVPVRLSWEHFYKYIKTIDATQASTCGICLEEIPLHEPIGRTSCSHEFHEGCIKTWLIEKCQTPKCPVCRHDVREMK